MNFNQRLDQLLHQQIPTLIATYKSLHAAPELSHYEEMTASLVAKELRSCGYAVTENVGEYEQPEWKGHGVVGLFENGPGPTVLVRTDLDALPIEEKTELPYASTVSVKTADGAQVSVMHACGHDLHATCFLGTARLLTDLRESWSGSVLMVGQPAEETADGANAMLRAGLYERFPLPDYALALHSHAELEAGKVGFTSGYFLASLNSVDITVRGIGGHGSTPEQTRDPILLAAQIILALQTIVSREISPLDAAVVSVGSIHGGTKYNIIPDEVHLQLTVRSYKEDVRERLLASIERISRGIALAAGVPDELTPLVKVNAAEFAPATYNDPCLSSRLGAVFREMLGEANVVDLPPRMGSEDFGRFGLERKIPTFMFFLGAVDPGRVLASKQGGLALPPLHSSYYAPLAEPTIRTGVKAMTSAVLDLVKKSLQVRGST